MVSILYPKMQSLACGYFSNAHSCLTLMTRRAVVKLHCPWLWVNLVGTSRSGMDLRHCSSASSFGIFEKLKDPQGTTASNEKIRKPSDKVLRVVDQILTLTLIEAADVCDLCQERLAERSALSSNPVVGRNPFPHPAGLFGGDPSTYGAGIMVPTPPQLGLTRANPSPSPCSAVPNQQDTTVTSANAKVENFENRAFVNVKLMSFNKSKKVAVVKEVRVITALGLKESKELVEASPKTVKKGVPREEAEKMKQKLEAAGAEVVIE